MDKLVVIRLNGRDRDSHSIDEYLENYLGEGWRIRHVACTAAGAGSGTSDSSDIYVTGWIAVTLEKE